ncbi:PREDICTED: CKLF-like MARVEL transmembrane domain-containing protein 4 [Nicrophorus vespilloides]|uniref:CKLF-like MARVEL transmembrane domain-containing protein 4 n=1 Tax=Nicrophorus vespilloides TaxID=110193 RepID=A0ABM1MID7_NICVS|nr:PREDICTED: CKLF-like MARVEL transmembrane domain-containing protein 4 [Nicrophorus vespilloides]
MAIDYIKTTPGILKAVEVVLNFIGFVSVAATGVSPRGDAFLVASVGGFLITGIMLVLFMLDLHEKIPIPWNRVEFFFCIIWAVFYLITAALVIDVRAGGYIAGGSFGLFATVAYLLDAYDKYRNSA